MAWTVSIAWKMVAWSNKLASSNSANSSYGEASRVLAWRFFAGRQRQALVSFISGVSIVGLAIAIALLILVLSVMNGFEKEFREKILGLAPHATMWFDQPRDDWRDIIDGLRAQQGIVRARPLVEFKAMAVAASQVRPMLIQGLAGDDSDFAQLITPYLRSAAINEGNAQGVASLASGEIILGAEVASALNLKPSDKLRLMVIGGDSATSSRSNVATQSYAFVVKAILATGTELDNALGLVNLDDASRLSGLGGRVQGVQIQVNDLFKAYSIATVAMINQQLPASISDWTRSFGNLYTAIQLSRQLVGLLLASIIAVAVFNIFVTLGMVVRHKQSEVAILRTMGMSRAGILRSFIMQGMLIAVIGCIAGVALGCLLAWLAPSGVGALEQVLGIAFLSTDIYPINYLPSEIRAADIMLVTLAALTMSLLATLYPAWRAASILPAQALRSQ